MTNRQRIARDWRVVGYTWLAVGVVWAGLTFGHHSWMRWEAVVAGLCMGIGISCLHIWSNLRD